MYSDSFNYLVFRLKINLHKSNLFSIGVDFQAVEHVTTLMACKVGTLPFLYLGRPIAIDMARTEGWKTFLQRFESKLSNWKI